MSYTDTVKAAKLAARDVLRAAQVERRLETIRGLNISVKNVDKEIASVNEESQIAVVEANALPDAHPRKEARVKAATETKASNDKYIADTLEKRKTDLAKEITDVTTEIADIESGKKKVDFEPMVTLAKKFVQERYQEAFVAGEYDAEAKKTQAND